MQAITTGATDQNLLAPSTLTLHKEISRKLLDDASSAVSDEDSPWRRQDVLVASFSHSGFKDMNERKGSYCIGVVSHPDLPKRVYKLVHTGPESMDPYIEYAEWLLKGRLWEDNPHFPRIYEITYSDDRNVALVVMEELQELHWENAPDYHKEDFWLARSCLGLHTNDAPSGWHSSNRPLKTAADAIKQQFGAVDDIEFDLHKGNVMLRGDILVLLDPLVWD